ncbi:MAG: hypothetical protein ACYTEE_06195 [Planctomycetota bacterium]|jgi:hypothetical protein
MERQIKEISKIRVTNHKKSKISFFIRFHRCLLVVFCMVLNAGLVLASPTGLNNIPTTDITSENTMVLQSWINTGYNRHPQDFVGFKYGLAKDVEIGVDWKAVDVAHAHVSYQAKYAFDIDGDIWRGVVGVADFSDNREHNGYLFPYAAMSLDLKALRLHFGYGAQPHDEAFFGGIDKTVSFLDRNLQLRADAIHINNKEDMKYSLGFLYELGQNSNSPTPRTDKTGILDIITKNVILETWISMPSTGNQEVYTVKLNYVIKF